MKLFINGYNAISPQENLLGIPNLVLSHLSPCSEPDYSEIFSSGESRRMSKIVKLGVASGLQAMQKAQLGNPDAIITGTAYGCMQDTQKFLDNMDKNQEEFLTPTSFIQSTHNTIGGLIAIKIGCRAPNYTFVHDTHAFENALIEAQISIKKGDNFLVGGFDHLPEKFATIYKHLGYWKEKDNENLIQSNSTGFYNGYGASFFVVSSEEKAESKVCIESIELLDSEDVIPQNLEADLVLYGINGDKENNSFYQQIRNESISAGYYKHLCGEYPTNIGVGMALACEILEQQKVPNHILLENEKVQGINSICLVEGKSKGKTSILKLSKCHQ